MAVEVALYLPALIGHFMLWVGLFNRLHATALPRPRIRVVERIIFFLVVAVPVCLFDLYWSAARSNTPLAFPLQAIFTTYTAGCWMTLLAGFPRWVRMRWADGTCSALLNETSRLIHVDQQLGKRPVGSKIVSWTVGIPGNQVFDLTVTEKHLGLPKLPTALEGLTIAHLSDLHFSGRVLQPYFDFVVDETNRLQPDLIMIAGDIVDREFCIPWIELTLGRLRSRYGTYFVLGNHDKRVPDPARVRSAMTACGFVDLGGRGECINIRNSRILLAGNESPWFEPVPDLSRFPPGVADFRLLLSHAPDQLPWALEHGFDLMLAGHTHGGQIRIPGLGPTISPSRFGARYASGTFVDSMTIMHVSRGISALHPIRFRCPPELALLKLGPLRRRATNLAAGARVQQLANDPSVAGGEADDSDLLPAPSPA